MTVDTNDAGKGSAPDLNRFMTEEPKFPQYPRPYSAVFANQHQAKPMIKLMTRAFQGKLKKGLFFHPKRKRARVI